MKGCLAAVGFALFLVVVASVVVAMESPGAIHLDPVTELPENPPNAVICVSGFVVVVLGILGAAGGFSASPARAHDGFIVALLAIAGIVALVAIYVALTRGVSW